MSYDEMEMVEKFERIDMAVLDNNKSIPLLELFKFFSNKNTDPEPTRSRCGFYNFTRRGSSVTKLPALAFQEALTHQKLHGGHIADILVQKRMATEEEIVVELTSTYGFPYLPLKNYSIDREVTRTIPCRVARKHMLIPIDKIQGTLMVAMANPLDSRAINEVESHTNCQIQIFVSTVSEIKASLNKFYEEEEFFSDPLLQ